MGGIAWVRRTAFGSLAVAVFLLTTNGVRAGDYNTDWTGIYGGAQLGGAWSDIRWQFANANYFNSAGGNVLGTRLDQDPQGLIGGVVGGYNFQAGPWMWGIEIAASAADMHQDRVSPFFPATDSYSSQVDWLTSIAGRVGYGWYRWMLYAKGGWAGGEANLTLRDPSNSVYASEDQWANGWTVGAGLDYRLYRNLSFGVAYDYADLNVDNKTITCPNCGFGPGLVTPSVNGDIVVQSVMARLTFNP
jgi:outer membrane immunogenic protein